LKIAFTLTTEKSGTLEASGYAQFSGSLNQEVGNDYKLSSPVDLTGSSGGSVKSFDLRFSK
jgi:hypothetical protein